jgi:hypothetical protein
MLAQPASASVVVFRLLALRMTSAGDPHEVQARWFGTGG